MASIRVSEFRDVTKVTADLMPDADVQTLIARASWLAYRISGRLFGHAIESVTTSGSEVLVKVYGHSLMPSGKVYIQGTGITALDQVVNYTIVDADTIKVTGITGASSGKGVMCVPMKSNFAIVEAIAKVNPGPIAKVDSVWLRSGQLTETVPFSDDPLLTTQYYCDVENGENWSCEVEFSNTVLAPSFAKRRYRILPVKQENRKTARVFWYAGCFKGIPLDVVSAIGAIAKTIGDDPVGEFKSESYDYYSYTRVDADEIRKYPTSAIATLLRYQVGL